MVIKSDAQLRALFVRILEYGAATQQVRVATLLLELEKIKAPQLVKDFVLKLSNDQLAHAVLLELQSFRS
jgi:hypothetical protein